MVQKHPSWHRRNWGLHEKKKLNNIAYWIGCIDENDASSNRSWFDENNALMNRSWINGCLHQSFCSLKCRCPNGSAKTSRPSSGTKRKKRSIHQNHLDRWCHWIHHKLIPEMLDATINCHQKKDHKWRPPQYGMHQASRSRCYDCCKTVTACRLQ